MVLLIIFRCGFSSRKRHRLTNQTKNSIPVTFDATRAPNSTSRVSNADPNGRESVAQSVLHCFIQIQSCLISTSSELGAMSSVDVISTSVYRKLTYPVDSKFHVLLWRSQHCQASALCERGASPISDFFMFLAPSEQQIRSCGWSRAWDPQVSTSTTALVHEKTIQHGHRGKMGNMDIDTLAWLDTLLQVQLTNRWKLFHLEPL